MSNADDGKTPDDDFELSLNEAAAKPVPTEPKPTADSEVVPEELPDFSFEDVAETPVEAAESVLEEPIVENASASASDVEFPSELAAETGGESGSGIELVAEEPVVESTSASTDDLELPAEAASDAPVDLTTDTVDSFGEEPIVESASASASDLEFPAEMAAETGEELPGELAAEEPIVESASVAADDLEFPSELAAEAGGEATSELAAEQPLSEGEALSIEPESLDALSSDALGQATGEVGEATTEAAIGEAAPSEEPGDETAEEEEAGPKKESIFARLAQANPYTVMLGLSLAAILMAVLFLFLEMGSYGFDIKATTGKMGL